MKKALGVAIIACALAIVIIPQFLNCTARGEVMKLANGKTAPMICFWTARAEIAVGVPIAALGSMMLFVRRKESLRYLGVMGTVLGVFVMLLPTRLIGVCSGPMLCHTVMQPSLVTLGFLVTAASLIGVTLSFGKGD